MDEIKVLCDYAYDVFEQYISCLILYLRFIIECI